MHGKSHLSKRAGEKRTKIELIDKYHFEQNS